MIRVALQAFKRGLFSFGCLLATLFFGVLFRARYEGQENVPPYGVIVVARHTSYWDVPLVAAALNWRRQVTFVAKGTLRRASFLLNWLISSYAISVDRDNFRASDFKSVMQAIETHPLIVIFPEGRIRPNGQVYSGAIRFAELSGREILPVRFKPRRGQYPPKYPFGFPALTMVVGRPFSLRDLEFDLSGAEDKAERYRRLSQLLMQRIDCAEAN